MNQRWLPSFRWRMGMLRTASIAVIALAVGQVAAESDPFEPISSLDATIPTQDLELGRAVVEFISPGYIRSETPKQGISLRFREDKNRQPRSRQAVSPKTTWTAPSSVRTIETTPKAEPKAESKADDPTLIARRRSRSLPKATSAPRKSKTPAQPAHEPIENFPVPRSTPYPGFGGKSVEQLPPLTRQQLRLRDKVRKVLAHYYNRPLNTRDRSPWEILHTVLSFETHSKVRIGGPQGKPITAVGWLCFNQPCKRRTLMYVNRDDELRVRVGPALQGHQGQLLAMFAQSRVNPSYPIRVEDRDFTVADLIDMEKRTCYPGTELTFKLISMSHYLKSEATWVNDRGMQWDIPKLIHEELRQPVRGAACGGTHRLAGLTLAYKTREQRGEPVDGEYLRAKQFTTRYQKYAYRLQNSDGSFSTEWFRGPGHEESVDRRLKTTGHLLEWLLYAASQKELRHSQTARAANYLANIMYNNRNKDWESGPLGHAVHALLLYDRMMFVPYDEPAQKTASKRARSSRSTKATNRR